MGLMQQGFRKVAIGNTMKPSLKASIGNKLIAKKAL